MLAVHESIIAMHLQYDRIPEVHIHPDHNSRGWLFLNVISSDGLIRRMVYGLRGQPIFTKYIREDQKEEILPGQLEPLNYYEPSTVLI
jgi:hypothetical protein